MENTRVQPVHGEIWKHFKGNLYEILECPAHRNPGSLCGVPRPVWGFWSFLQAACYVYVPGGS